MDIDNSNILFFLDKKIPFRKKIDNLEILNIYQLLFQRYGLGKSLAYRIIIYSAIHPSVLPRNFRHNIINEQIKNVLIRNDNELDTTLEKKMIIRIQRNVNLYNYRGSRYIERLPMNGQRRRSNANTCKKVRPYITTHLSSFQRRKQNLN